MSINYRNCRYFNCASSYVTHDVFSPYRNNIITVDLNMCLCMYEELSDLYTLPNIVRVVKLRRMRWSGHVARMGKGRGVHRVLVGKPEGKRPLGRPRCRWEDNIKMDLQEVGGELCGLDGVGSG